MNDWLTTILIVLPVAGALLVAIAPLTTYWLGSLAALISLVEVGFWITSVGRFDFGTKGLQFEQHASWFSDLHVSWHVGQYAFSLPRLVTRPFHRRGSKARSRSAPQRCSKGNMATW